MQRMCWWKKMRLDVWFLPTRKVTCCCEKAVLPSVRLRKALTRADTVWFRVLRWMSRNPSMVWACYKTARWTNEAKTGGWFRVIWRIMPISSKASRDMVSIGTTIRQQRWTTMDGRWNWNRKLANWWTIISSTVRMPMGWLVGCDGWRAKCPCYHSGHTVSIRAGNAIRVAVNCWRW